MNKLKSFLIFSLIFPFTITLSMFFLCSGCQHAPTKSVDGQIEVQHTLQTRETSKQMLEKSNQLVLAIKMQEMTNRLETAKLDTQQLLLQQQQTKLLQEQKITDQETQKTAQEQERTKQEAEKTAQEVERTKQAMQKTKQQEIAARGPQIAAPVVVPPPAPAPPPAPMVISSNAVAPVPASTNTPPATTNK